MHDEEAIIAIVAIVMILGIPIAWLILHYLHAIAKVFFETRLKREMVARGFTPHEIVQVVQSQSGKPSPYETHSIPPAKPIRQPSVQAG